jgi:hypothetical protein
MEQNYNVVLDYLTNDNTKVKKLEYINSITFLNNHNYNMQDLKFLIDKFIDKTTFYYRIEKDAKMYHDLIRKILFNNNEENVIKEFAKNKYLTLFINRVITPEDYKYFKDAFLEYIQNGIRYKLDRFKYFEDFIGVTKPGEAKSEKIILHFYGKTGSYMETKPIHGSQKSNWISDETLEVKLDLIINYEFERLILSYANNVKQAQ